jgi:hypothetical protein
MNLIINLTPSEEAQISAAAKETGLAPAELVKKLVKEHLPVVPTVVDDDLDAKLHKRQEQDGIKLMPDVSTQALFAQWAEEDAQMTNEERAENERIYTEIEKHGIPRVQL